MIHVLLTVSKCLFKLVMYRYIHSLQWVLSVPALYAGCFCQMFFFPHGPWTYIVVKSNESAANISISEAHVPSDCIFDCSM